MLRDGPTDQPTNMARCRVACPRLKTGKLLEECKHEYKHIEGTILKFCSLLSNFFCKETRLDTRHQHRGWLGRGSNAKKACNSKCYAWTNGRTDGPINMARCIRVSMTKIFLNFFLNFIFFLMFINTKIC